jgi:hypothetical protein
MDIVNIESLISQNRSVDVSAIDTNSTYIQIGVFQTGNRKRTGNPNSYAPYVISIAELLSAVPPVAPVVNNGLSTTLGVIQLGGPLVKNTDINVAGFNFRVLNGANLSAHFTNRILADAAGGTSVSWGARELYDSTGVASALWDLRILSDNTANNSIDWAARLMYDPAGVAVLNWTGTNAAVQVTGTTAAVGAYAFRVYNSTPTDIFSIINDGTITVHGGNGFNGTFEIHQKAGTTHILSVYDVAYNKQMLTITDNGAAGGLFIGAGALQINAYSGQSIFTGSNVSVRGTVAGGDILAVVPSAGNGGAYISDVANEPFIYMQDSTAATRVRISTSGDSWFIGGNTGFGFAGAMTARLQVRGNATATDYAQKIEDSAGNPLLYVRNDGRVNMAALPVAAAGLAAGDLWNNAGVVNIV